ncbi:hypothetical protein IMZ31_20530 (plasmid) [Pontibacillus sp. ALD_SL1]|uniref:hypothetical protein n=1 Tax=Pontibacillus sp. ALD_SL1 TaxID=2777185 RepID=UPI001A95F801|nr:hypothetical protein [Pontibacillus sp. ALD_SL1]QST02937.1 hypothetical protein IMZ31_20530 [Pontibacillus sp. ALD_SL1]
MYKTCRKLMTDHHYRGWRLEEDDQEGLYLSKFDDNLNDDEYRFYLSKNGDLIYIRTMEKIKSYDKILTIPKDNPYFKKAQSICELFSHQKVIRTM